jgi:hypothetical protein
MGTNGLYSCMYPKKTRPSFLLEEITPCCVEFLLEYIRTSCGAEMALPAMLK